MLNSVHNFLPDLLKPPSDCEKLANIAGLPELTIVSFFATIHDRLTSFANEMTRILFQRLQGIDDLFCHATR
jgi:hypothetical protein